MVEKTFCEGTEKKKLEKDSHLLRMVIDHRLRCAAAPHNHDYYNSADKLDNMTMSFISVRPVIEWDHRYYSINAIPEDDARWQDSHTVTSLFYGYPSSP